MKGIKQIKNYRLTRQVGKGATGIVYEAIDDKTNTIVAIKAIPSSKLNEKRVMDNFKRELKLLHGLNHTNIIKIEGVEKTVNNIYLILEYCNGGNLYDYLYYYQKTNKIPIPEKYVQKILRQLIDGLEYMHNCRTVHRDIKLENILLNFNTVSNKVAPGENPQIVEYGKVSLDEDFSVKIADLGYARELEGAGVASTICGTPITMAPDIINLFDESKVKDQKYNSTVDLWSLGAITYELLIGRPPFYASNYKQLFEEVMNGKYTLPKNLSLSVEAITFINGLLQFFPDKRMSWKEIRYHPFLSKDISTFHVLDLHTVDSDYKNPEQLQLNTKDCDNFLWILFKNYTHNLPLDKVNADIYQDPIIEKIKTESSDKQDPEEECENINNVIRLADNDNDNNNKNNKPNITKPEVTTVEKNNMIFGKIFTEIKEELKNSRQKEGSEESKKKETEKKIREEAEKKEAEIKRLLKEEAERQRLKEEAELNRQLIEAEERRRLQVEAERRRLEEEEEEAEIQAADERRQLQEEAERKEAEENEKKRLKEQEEIEKERRIKEENELREAKRKHLEEEQTRLVEELAVTPQIKNSDNNLERENITIDSTFRPVSIEYISEEKDICYFKTDERYHNPSFQSDDFIQVSPYTKEEEPIDDSMWEMISTTSIIGNDYEYDYECENSNAEYQVINEYFK